MQNRANRLSSVCWWEMKNHSLQQNPEDFYSPPQRRFERYQIVNCFRHKAPNHRPKWRRHGQLQVCITLEANRFCIFAWVCRSSKKWNNSIYYCFQFHFLKKSFRSTNTWSLRLRALWIFCLYRLSFVSSNSTWEWMSSTSGCKLKADCWISYKFL